jgi:peptidoglycan/LPS O-acetylase OafA/YrhL
VSVASTALAAASPAAVVQKAPGPGHVPALDGVRGVAIILVMLYHFNESLKVLGLATPVLAPLELGWSGVDVFFALSGFLITGILLDTKDAPNYFRSFYARRFLRIFPLYYIALAAVFLIRAMLPDAGVWGDHSTATSAGSLTWPAFFLQNAAFLLDGGAIGLTAHYWSLAVEEHFYLVWPFLVWMARSRGQVVALAVAAVVLSIAGRGLVLLHGDELQQVLGLTPLRMDGLAIGAIAAVLVRSYEGEALARWATLALATSGLAACGLVLARGATSVTDPAIWLLFFPLVATATASALIIALRPGRFSATLSLAPLRWFGKYSFGLYVWHPIVGVLLFHSTVAIVHVGQSPARILAAAALILAIDLLVAWLSFHLWEKRFLALKGAFAPVAPAERG